MGPNMKHVILFLSIFVALALLAGCGNFGQSVAPEDTRRVYESQYNYAQTQSRLIAALNGRRLKIVQQIDHSRDARMSGVNLEPSILITFSDPKFGSLLMAENPQMGIELPLKALVYEQSGKTYVQVTDMKALSRAYGLNQEKNSTASNVALTLDLIAQEATE